MNTRFSLVLFASIALSGCSAELALRVGANFEDTAASDEGGRLRLDVTPPASAGNGLLLPQSKIVEPWAYEGVDLALVPTRTISGFLTADVARGWTLGAPTTEEPLMADLVALPGGGRVDAAATSAEDGSFTFSFPGYADRFSLAIVPSDASMAPLRVVTAPTSDQTGWNQNLSTGIPVYGRVLGKMGGGLERGVAGVQMRLVRLVDGEPLASGIFTTDETGWYVARVDEVGEYELEVVGGPVSAENQVAPSFSVTVLVEDADGVELPISLGEVRDATVSGVAVDADGNRVRDARVRFRSVSLDGGVGSLVVETEANSDGEFVSRSLLPGVYTIEVMPPFSSEGVTASPAIYGQRIVDGTDLGRLALDPPATLSGAVVGALGGPVGDALVVVTEIGFGGNVYFTRTDKDGSFALPVPDVPLAVAITPASSTDGAVANLELAAPATDLAFTLEPGLLVSGVLSFEGSPVAYGSVEVRDADTGLLLGQVLSGEDGAFSLRVSVPVPGEDDSADTGADTGSDTAADTGSDTGADTGSDTGADTGSDTGADTGSDTAADTGSDTGADTGSDTAAARPR
jgi:hypothetical protein